MAYGLDFEEVYYADHERNDIGVLQTYEIDIDLAGDKDFRVVSPEPVIPVGGFWYIQDTEYGGIVDKFETDSDEEKITYGGRTFRGILHSHIVDVGSVARDINSVPIKEYISGLLQECGLASMFTVDDPYTDASIPTTVYSYRISFGTSLYDAIIGGANSVDLTVLLTYQKDHLVHITPVLIQDYVDFFKGSKYDGIGFRTELDTSVVNHLIMRSIEEDEGSVKAIRTMHFFTDSNGGIQPYTLINEPIKDSQYITDKRYQVLFGLDEVTEVKEINNSTVENYEVVQTCPSDWTSRFGDYYKQQIEDGEVSFIEYEAVGNEVYTLVSTQPSDWSTNYSSYYIGEYDETTQQWTYTGVSADTVEDEDFANATQITEKPYDWSINYSNYVYKFQSGTGIVPRHYEGVQKNNYVLLTTKPSDWSTNFSSYYRKVYKKVSYEKTSSGKKKKVVTLVDTTDHKDAYYVACRADDDKKDGTVPSFKKRPHYRNDPYTVAPKFDASNCYRLRMIVITPTFDNLHRYFRIDLVYNPPEFVIGECYTKVLDHYAVMVDQAKDFFEDERVKSYQELEIDDFVVNIGDIVGGTDELTNTNIVGSVANIEAKIENGLIDVVYTVKIDDYTTALIN